MLNGYERSNEGEKSDQAIQVPAVYISYYYNKKADQRLPPLNLVGSSKKGKEQKQYCNKK